MQYSTRTILLTALLASLSGLSAQTATLNSPSSATFNDAFTPGFPLPPFFLPEPPTYGNIQEFGNAAALIDGSGLSGTPAIANYTTITHATPAFGATPNAWASIDPGSAGGDFFAEVPSYQFNGPGGTFTFTFNTPLDLTDMVSWNYSFSNTGVNGSNVKIFDFRFDRGEASAVFVNGISRTVESAQGFGPGVFSFGSTIAGVTSVTATPRDNMFGDSFSSGAAVGGDRYGLAEVRFLAADPVPEPSAALLSRRRRA